MQVVYVPVGLQVLLILMSVLVLVFVIYSSKKSKMEVRYAILWITWAIFVLVIGIWPDIAYIISRAIGIQSVTTFIFLVMIGLLFLFNYYLFMKMSRMSRDIKVLNYEVARLKQEKEEKEKVHG